MKRKSATAVSPSARRSTGILIPYGRKSSKEDPRVSRARQVSAFARWGSSSDVELAELVWENSVSGSWDWKTRGLGLAIARVAAGEADGIIVEEQSRLSREDQLKTAEVWDALQRAGARLVCIADGLDTATGDQELNFAIRAALSREQWKQYARRMDHSKRDAVLERGVHISGRVPFGYLRPARGQRLVPDPAVAPVITAAFELRASGASISAVRELLEREVPAGPSGQGGWIKLTVKRLLVNPVYRGEARQGDYVNPRGHDPLVDEATFAACVALDERRETARVDNRSVKALLAGIVRCRGCGYSMVRSSSKRNGVVRWNYVCRGRSAKGKCPAPTAAPMELVDELVVAAVLEALEREGELERQEVGPNVNAIHVRLAAARAKREPFEDPDYVALLGLEAAGRALAKVDLEISAVEAELAAAIPNGGGVERGAWRTRALTEWGSLEVDERREIIADMLVAVHVSKAPRGTALVERLHPTWRGGLVPISPPNRGGRPSRGPEVDTGVLAA